MAARAFQAAGFLLTMPWLLRLSVLVLVVLLLLLAGCAI